eukprot:SAG11_NODE_1282_length_5310_cov_24.980426_6_plen_58_part_00
MLIKKPAMADATRGSSCNRPLPIFLRDWQCHCSRSCSWRCARAAHNMHMARRPRAAL